MRTYIARRGRVRGDKRSANCSCLAEEVLQDCTPYDYGEYIEPKHQEVHLQEIKDGTNYARTQRESAHEAPNDRRI